MVSPEQSTVPQNQEKMMQATQTVLASIAADIRSGLLETVGIESRFSIDGDRCAMILELPAETDTADIARAIDLENVEAWCDAENNVNIAVNPWYSTKDVDQTVLSAIKVIHVLLGIHAGDETKPLSLGQKFIKSISEIMKIQQEIKKK